MNTLISTIVQTQGAVAVGSSAVLGVILVIDIMAGIGVLVVWYQFEREERYGRRQCHQNHREKYNDLGEKHDAPTRNLGKLRRSCQNIGDYLRGLRARCLNLHVAKILFEIGAKLLNPLLKFFGLAHKSRKTPNANLRDGAPETPASQINATAPFSGAHG